MNPLCVQRVQKLIELQLLVVVPPKSVLRIFFGVNPSAILCKQPILSALVVQSKFDVLYSLLKDFSTTLGEFSLQSLDYLVIL